MPDEKISALTELTDIADNDLLAAVDTSAGSTKKVQIDTLYNYIANNKTLIINGNFGINQRVVSGTVVLSFGDYGHDRFKAGASGCTYTFSTTANVTTLTISAGSLIQVVEGVNIQSGTHALSWSGTAQGQIDSGGYGSSGVTATLTGGTNATIEFNTGTLFLVQLEEGSIATQFEHRNIGEELALCQGYYTKFFGGGPYMHFASGTAQATANARYIMHLPVTMRGIPTMLQAGTFRSYGLTTVTSVTITLGTYPSNTTVQITTTTTGHGAGEGYILTADNDATAYIAFSAEL